MPVTDRVTVAFKAEDGGGEGELSWGQQELFLVMRRRRVWIPIGVAVALPAGVTVDRVAAKLRFLMGRYPTLRTRLRFDPDGTRQVVADKGVIPLEIADIPDDADPYAAASRLSLQYMDRDYDFTSEWPIRMAVVRQGGALTHRVIVLCHLVLDGTGAATLGAELDGWDPETDRVPRPPAALPPLEQVRRQRLPAAQRQTGTALQHWAKLLRAAPARRFGNLGDEQRPRYWKGILRSPAIHRAVGMITARTRADSASVLLALYAVALARMTRLHPVLVQVIVGNRFRPGFADTVSPVAQEGLCLVEVAGRTIDEVVAEARQRRLAAYKHAYYDPCQREELVTRVVRERGDQLQLGCYLNDRRPATSASGPVSSSDPVPGRLVAPPPLGGFEWNVIEDIEFTDPLYLFVDEVGDPPAIDLTISADSRHVSPANLEALVREMEALAVAAADDPALPTGVPGAA